jgi:hypothetical protein
MNQAGGVLNIDGIGREREAGFWQRQFQPQATLKQSIFDVFFGIAMPVACFIFDPMIFRGNFIGGWPLFGKLQFPVYAMAFIEISALATWLCGRKRLGDYAVAIGGFLYAGALISLLIGIILFPLSLLGIAFAGLGLLGFTPFFTALVFWRNGRSALAHNPEAAGGRRKLASLALALVFVIGAPLALHLKISSSAQESLRKILEGDEREAAAAADHLRFIGYFTQAETDKIVWAYHNEQDQARRERLARIYLSITGSEIEARLTYLLD